MTNKKTNGVMAGVVGAVVGASAVVLSDEKNRNKIEKKFNELKKDGEKVYANLSKDSKDEIEKAKKSIKKAL